LQYTVKNIVLELQSYLKQTSQILLDESLTSIQKIKHLESIKEAFAKKEITIISEQLDYNSENIKDFKNIFLFSSLNINDSGVLTDVSTSGEFPIRISIDNNIFVIYEPRNLKHLPDFERRKISNSEFSHFEKGSNYQFSGEVIHCNYYTNQNRYEFVIAGNHSKLNILSSSPNSNRKSLAVKDLYYKSIAHPIVFLFICALLLFFAQLFTEIKFIILSYFFILLTGITFIISFIGFTKHVQPVFSNPSSRFLGKESTIGDPGFVNGGCIGCLMIIVLVLISGSLLMIFGIK